MPRGTEHILLVDDEKSIADVTTSMLERLGYKVIICTGFSEQLDSRKSKVIGIEGFLHKPVLMTDLARCVRSVLDG